MKIQESVTSVVGHFSDIEARPTNVRFEGKKQKCRSTLDQCFKLLVPRNRELLEEIIKPKIDRLEAF